MEDILDVYNRSYNPKKPVICVDEVSKQLTKEVKIPIRMKPGQPLKFDCQYERNSVVNMFVILEPLTGWRHIIIFKQRRKIEWSQVMKIISDELFPHAETIVMVQDNLNTHKLSCFYEYYEPQEVKRLADRFEMHYTPKHASWLNMAEIEISVLSRQCLSRRIPDETSTSREVKAWQENRNQNKKSVDWQFTTKDAPIKLKHLYPSYSV